ncbi:cellulase family glycosylhydrolase [Carboxylicivirga sediminis]|uniref:Cellulase family glycosylhydrolase n=1 Tax=Carboxylicivirga sediminis TaxID=2006564 RepID=A0A941IXB4_9BACT|nr:cellulase family glycosylhydrolase [Carboxylicivirga sediminis]MBR8535890.1 cellulase family glycosylhydrolase [Carboxylicivirga sediminis]
MSVAILLICIVYVLFFTGAENHKAKDVEGLILTLSNNIPEYNAKDSIGEGKNIQVKEGQFCSQDGRTLFLRGINLGGSSKVPYIPNIGSHVKEGFFNGTDISFVGRPFPINEADKHFKRLKKWGFHFVRFIVTWEAIEHSGPGIYDYEYIKYVKELITKAAAYDINVFIDPHQDLWSRYSGGDGAPLWTFEAAGFNVKNFLETDAAFVHNIFGDPYPQMVWFSNYYKLASCTMFTLFFAGNDFAPHVTVNDSIPIQDFLQSHYINSMAVLANELKELPNVVGFELMNEPSSGYVGVNDLSQPFPTSVVGLTPTPFQGMLLGAGIPQEVQEYELGKVSLIDKGKVLVNRERKLAWKKAEQDIWKEAGIWQLRDGEEPKLLKPDYFTRVNGKNVNFNNDYYIPFIKAYQKAIHSIDPDWFLCVDNVLFPLPHKLPMLKEQEISNLVDGSHWYDDATLVTKRYVPWLGLLNDEILLGKRQVYAAFVDFLSQMQKDTKMRYGKDAVTLLGEFGIPFDMNNRTAYETGDYSVQNKALERCFSAIEDNLLHYTLWNYTADNTNERGDQWNGEDLSVFSLSQVLDANDLNSGGRALDAVVRPYPYRVNGQLVKYSFSSEKGEMELEFNPGVNCELPTEVFLPEWHFQNGYEVYATGGTLMFNNDADMLYYTPKDKSIKQRIVIRRNKE